MESRSPFRGDVVSGKVALVTGGGSGIGFEIARQLGIHGALLMIMGRRLPVLEAAKRSLESQGIQVEYVQGDVRFPEDAARAVAKTLENYGRVDVLVNSAAGNFLAPAEVLTPKGFKTVIEIDTIGTFNMCHAAFSSLRSAKGGVIINITATLQYGATWYQSHASAAKAAVDSLTRSLCLEWGPDYGIRVNGIAPGPIINTAGFTKLGVNSEEAKTRTVTSPSPAGRLGTSWDVAMVAVFLASDAGSFITGETIVVDGGIWLYYPPPLPREAVSKASRGVEAASREVGVPNKIKSKL